MLVKDREINFEIKRPREKYTCKPVADVDVETLPEEEWLKWREHGPHYADPKNPEYIPFAFGGSSQGAINNAEDSFSTALQLYHEKLGIKPAITPEKNDVALRLGHIYERSVGDKFLFWMEKKHPELQCSINFYKKMLRCDKRNEDGEYSYPYCLMDIDGVLSITNQKGEKANMVYEAKTIDPNNYKKINMVRKGICPPSYMYQISYSYGWYYVQKL